MMRWFAVIGRALGWPIRAIRHPGVRAWLGILGWAALHPVLVVSAVVIYSLSQGSNYFETVHGPTHMIYLSGLLASLFGQMLVHHYFRHFGHYRSVRFPLETFFEVLYPGLLMLVLIGGLLAVERYQHHIAAAITYVTLLALWDLAGWRWARATPHQTARGRIFRRSCRSLFLHIDGVSVAGLESLKDRTCRQ